VISEDLACQEVVELVTEYLEGALTPEAAAAFEDHLAICEGCVAYLEQLREAVRLAGTLHQEDVPEPLMGRLLEAFRGWRRA
jgi:anti-sigma factor RsiW